MLVSFSVRRYIAGAFLTENCRISKCNIDLSFTTNYFKHISVLIPTTTGHVLINGSKNRYSNSLCYIPCTFKIR